MSDLVECYAGASYPQRPLAVRVGEERLEVLEILREYRLPGGKGFRVRVQGERIYELQYQEYRDEWLVIPV